MLQTPGSARYFTWEDGRSGVMGRPLASRQGLKFGDQPRSAKRIPPQKTLGKSAKPSEDGSDHRGPI